MNTTDRYAKSREALEMEVSAMRELPRDLVTILRTEAKNQRTPPIDYVIAEDGGRMVHRPEPDIAMAELLEEAAAALAEKEAENERLRKALEASASALDEAMEDVEHWGAYAGEYFQDKHDLDGDLSRISEQATAARRALEGGE